MSIVIKNKSNIHVVDIKDEEGNLLHQLKFNLDDVNLTGKVLEFYNNAQFEIAKLQKEQEEIKTETVDLDLEQIKAMITEEDSGNIKLPEEFSKIYDIQKRGFQTIRKLFDDFLGEGTCQKIFGDVDSYDLFEQFIDGLVPEFEKMGVKIDNMKKQLYAKYSNKNERVLR